MHPRVRSSVPWIWLFVVIGFSPAILEVARGAVETPRSPTVVLAAVLMTVAAAGDHTVSPPWRAGGLALVASAAILELLGVSAGTSMLSRLAVALALIGTSRLVGWPALPTVLLSLWLVPMPVSLLDPVREPLENGAAAFVAALARVSDGSATATGSLVRVGGRVLELRSADAGLHLAQLLGLLGWYAGVRQGGSVATAASWAIRAALLALLLQPAFLVLAAGALLTVGPALARALLDVVCPGGVALTAVVLVERRRRADAPKDSC